MLAAGGLFFRCIGRAEAWLLISRNARPRDLAPALRAARSMMDKYQRRPLFRRIECFVLESAPWRESFAKNLGFALEGIHPCWDELEAGLAVVLSF